MFLIKKQIYCNLEPNSSYILSEHMKYFTSFDEEEM